MPGFFPSKTANTLTAQSQYYLDWSRVGGLIASGQHRYTWQQLAQRGLVVAAMAYGAYEGYHYAGEEESGFTSSLYSMAGCFVGFVVSHIAVIVPLIYKRHQMSQHCHAAEKTILSLLNELQEIGQNSEHISALTQQIALIVDATMSLNLSDDKQARASQTWGRRKALMDNIVEKLDNDIKRYQQLHETDTQLIKNTAFWSLEKLSWQNAFNQEATPDESARPKTN